MNIRAEIEKGYEGRFTFTELVDSDLSGQERADAERVRLEGIRRRWLVPDGNVPRLVKREQVEEDIAFQHSVIEGLKKLAMTYVQQRDQANFAAQQLHNRVQRLEAEKGEKKLVHPSGQELRAVLQSRGR